MRPTITLTTDFGTADGYAGEMKGVVLTRAPEVRIVDVTHRIPPGDVAAGAWALRRVWDRFPEDTVHLVVVDPGVGSDRRPMAAKIASRWFVGPDNGLLTHVLGQGDVADARRLDPDAIGLEPLSDTFHGRDLFAPAAAHLVAGGSPGGLGSRMDAGSLVRLSAPKPERRPGPDGSEEVRGRIVHVDRFGNLITNVPSGWLPEPPVVAVGSHRLEDVGRSFAAAAPGAPVLIRGSGGTLEICVRGGSAAETLGVERGASVRVKAAG
ncbi:MAG: SAM hydrolase/SAM-dependent halogenase family protein [Gemmatimonadota bacterium]